jgi:hypothetical protein
MLTLSSAFTNAFKAGNVEPVLTVEIWTGTGDGDVLAFCTGSRIIEFSAGLYNPFSDSNTGAKTAYPSVAVVSPMSVGVDPFERNIQRSTCSVTFHDDGALRSIISSTRLLNQSVTIKLGTHEISSSNDWAPVFRGFIGEIQPREGQIDLVLRDMFQYLNKDYYGAYFNKHPLEALKRIVDDCGVPASMVDSTSFDPTDSAYSDIAHYCVTYTPKWNEERGGTGVGLQMAPEQVEPIETLQRCQDLARVLVGSLFNDERGVLSFKRFHLASATVSDHLTADDIGVFEQGETILINEIDLEISTHWLLGWSEETGKVSIRDEASQTAHSFPGLSTGEFNRSIKLSVEDLQARLHSGIGVTDGVVLAVNTPCGLSGTRITGTFTPGTTWNSLQTSGTELSAARPGYYLVDDEVMKSESGAFYDNSYQIVYDRDAEGNITGELKVPRLFYFTVATADRGAMGTTEETHNAAASIYEPTASPVMDLTMAEKFGTTQLTRFANGCPTATISTNLSKWSLQVGDFITLENDFFLT